VRLALIEETTGDSDQQTRRRMTLAPGHQRDHVERRGHDLAGSASGQRERPGLTMAA